MKIAHISDIHIKNFKYHKQYNEIFEDLYSKLRELKPDIIVNTGDTAHTKLDLSPDYFDMTAKFFENLASIAPLHVVIGNHDLNLSNKQKQDAISPIVKALKNSNIYFHKFSTKFVLNEQYCFHVLALTDKENWKFDVEQDKINILLFHASVAGSETDPGYVMTHADIDLQQLSVFDYGLLGDIHKTNQIIDNHGRCRYAGSLIQQNHGESNDKGFLLWDIKSKTDFNVAHYPLKNNYPFITIELNESGEIPDNIHIVPNATLRLLSNYNLPSELMKKASDVAKERFKPEIVTFLVKNVNKTDGLGKDMLLIKENLREKITQEKLICDFLTPFKVSNDVLQEIYAINARYNSTIESKEEVARNVNWKLKRIEWDNLFNYGEDNYIDVSSLNGVVGIFGKNYSGKSSIIDTILYSIFNTTSKNERKTTNVINQNKQDARAKAIIDVNGFEYQIDRRAEKYTKKVKGEIVEEAKTTLDLQGFDSIINQTEQLNELSRTDTDKYIRKLFGTIDDFTLTSLSSQLDSMSFIKEGSTRRKEILARFLDLDIFESKFKMAKDESSALKGILKKLEGKEYDKEINENETLLYSLKQSNIDRAKEIENVKNNISCVQNKIDNVEQQIKDHGSESVDIDLALKEKDKLEVSLKTYKADLLNFQNEHNECKKTIKKLQEFFKNFDLKELKNKKDFIASKQQEINSLYSQITITNKEISNVKDKIKLLNDIPCGTPFINCKFIKDAYQAKMMLPLLEDSNNNDFDEHKKLAKEIEELNINEINAQISKYEKLLITKNDTEKKILKLQFDIHKVENLVQSTNSKLEEINNIIETYKNNSELFIRIEELKNNKNSLNNELKQLKNVFTNLDEQLIETYIKIGSIENKIETLKNEKQELEKYRNEYAAYDYFMRCMHPNGISYEIIKKKLPIINYEISKILSNIVNFEIFFEDDGAKLNVFIKYPKWEARPIEMGSGAEKSIASMAIRLAMLQVSNLPKSNFMVMDEPGTSLDSENMEGFIRILDMAKNYFDVIFLISHMDALKDVADTIITIDKRDGYANVRV